MNLLIISQLILDKLHILSVFPYVESASIVNVIVKLAELFLDVIEVFFVFFSQV